MNENKVVDGIEQKDRNKLKTKKKSLKIKTSLIVITVVIKLIVVTIFRVEIQK